MTLPPPPLVGIAGVLISLAALLAVLGWWQRRCAPHAELVRKTAHVGMGLVTLGFPWLFGAVWPVWALCAGSVAMLAAVRWWRPLRPAMGGVLARVGRDGAGEFYFSLSVALVFWLSRDAGSARVMSITFMIPLLILTLADAVGALVGVRYGRARYTAGNGYKSVEGSLAFFIVAFFSTHVPLLLSGATPPVESLLIGLLLGLLVMLLEAVCNRGTDNLIVPLASFVALRIYLQLHIPALALRLAALAGVTILMLVWRRRTYLDDSAPLAGALVLYLSGSLGGWPWLIGPAALLVGYTLFCPDARIPALRPSRHNVDAVACVASAGLIWLFAARVTGWGETLLFPFTLAFAAHLGMIALAYLRCGGKNRGLRALAASTGIAVAIVLIPYVILCARPASLAVWQFAAGTAMTFGAVALFARWQHGLDDCPVDLPRWTRQGAVAALASLAGLVMMR